MAYEENVAHYVRTLIHHIAESGVADVVICPGSRSTPLALACEQHEALQTWMHVDERSAGFFALGMAKVKKQPVGLVCSSGTAAANFYPAVIEAYQSRVPLVVLTADRPHELRDVGAPQAINQIDLYHHYVKWFVDMALPDAVTDHWIMLA